MTSVAPDKFINRVGFVALSARAVNGIARLTDSKLFSMFIDVVTPSARQSTGSDRVRGNSITVNRFCYLRFDVGTSGVFALRGNKWWDYKFIVQDYEAARSNQITDRTRARHAYNNYDSAMLLLGKDSEIQPIETPFGDLPIYFSAAASEPLNMEVVRWDAWQIVTGQTQGTIPVGVLSKPFSDACATRLSQAAFAKLLQQYPEDSEKLLQHVITQHVVDHIGSPLYPVRWSSGVYDVSNIYVKVNTPVYIRPDDQLSAKLAIGSLDYTLRADTNPANRSNRHNRRNDNQDRTEVASSRSAGEHRPIIGDDVAAQIAGQLRTSSDIGTDTIFGDEVSELRDRVDGNK